MVWKVKQQKLNDNIICILSFASKHRMTMLLISQSLHPSLSGTDAILIIPHVPPLTHSVPYPIFHPWTE